MTREIGTRIVKWNSTGKGVAFYRSIGDHRCANVDGAYASLEPDGTTINGVYYPYYKSESRLPGMFDTCHPYCRHRLSPVPEETLPAPSPGERPHVVPSRQELHPEQDVTGLSQREKFKLISGYKAAEKEHEKVFPQSYYAKLSDTEIRSRHSYTSTGYKAINGVLRGDVPITEEVRQRIESIKSAIAKHELPEDYKLFRGFRHSQTERELLNMVNERSRQYSDHAFLSTSFSKDTALAFAETGDEYARKIVMEIDTPQGTKVMSGNAHEKELVLMPDTKILISSIEVTETHIYVKGKIR